MSSMCETDIDPEDPRNPIVTVCGVEVNVVELFQNIVGTEPVNSASIREMLTEVLRERGIQRDPDAAEVLDVLGRAFEFFKIEFGYEGRKGFFFLEEFSGPPV